MINHISFQNFKALREVSISLEPLTVFVGPNSSGKTSILQGVAFLLELANNTHYQHILREWAFEELPSKAAADCCVTASLDAGAVRVVLRRESPTETHQQTTEPVVTDRGWRIYLEGNLGSTQGGWQDRGQCRTLMQSLPHARLLRLEAKRLAAPFYSDQVEPVLGADGTGLPSVLASMVLTYPDEFARVQADLQKVIPAVRRVRLARAKLNGTTNQPVGDTLLLDLVGAASVAASQVSEGTLLVLGLLTALHMPPVPKLLLLDDLGHGLHPKAQWALVGVLRQLMKERSDVQILATTHSPLLLDKALPQEVRLTTSKEDGSIACASMTEHPDFARWKGDFRPGEFWSIFGENWAVNHGTSSRTLLVEVTA